MALLVRGAIAPPTLPRETVQVDALGAEVVVRGITGAERLAMLNVDPAPAADAAAPAENPNQRYAPVSRLLAMCVLASDDEPLFTEAQWNAFGGQHLEAWLQLFDVARKLSGLDAEDAKKK